MVIFLWGVSIKRRPNNDELSIHQVLSRTTLQHISHNGEAWFITPSVASLTSIVQGRVVGKCRASCHMKTPSRQDCNSTYGRHTRSFGFCVQTACPPVQTYSSSTRQTPRYINRANERVFFEIPEATTCVHDRAERRQKPAYTAYVPCNYEFAVPALSIERTTVKKYKPVSIMQQYYRSLKYFIAENHSKARCVKYNDHR